MSGCDLKEPITKLVWQDNIEVETVHGNWQEAINSCENLSLGGFNDWRLPNQEELSSIVDVKRKPTIQSRFDYGVSAPYWSSSSNVDNSSDAWYVNFYNGHNYAGTKENNFSVRCV
ncbi:MAG: DUF1566 domain-containing protein, partial [Sulfuricurvum sp.]|nr:DUF1566 domain-containing protein [Sulfuricurvum sp.]